MTRTGAWLVLALALGACGPADEVASQNMDVKVDTTSELAWAQHQENLRFAESYQPTCVPSEDSWRPRVLVSGFGRFQNQRVNATGMMVSELLDELDYPLTDPPEAGQIDPPGPQTAVALGSLSLDGVGEVDLCAMVLPVFWDLASVLVLKEVDVFLPDVVIMNGVASSRQPLWLELGAVNRATALEDGSGILEPVEEGAPLIPSATDDEYARGNLASWWALKDAVGATLEELREVEREDGAPLGEVVSDVLLASFPRGSNTYLCNNTTYTVSYLMDHPHESFTLLEASQPRAGQDGTTEPDGIAIELSADHSWVPRWFVHWPSDLKDAHLIAGAEVMRAMMATQLVMLWDLFDYPVRGDAEMGDF